MPRAGEPGHPLVSTPQAFMADACTLTISMRQLNLIRRLVTGHAVNYRNPPAEVLALEDTLLDAHDSYRAAQFAAGLPSD